MEEQDRGVKEQRTEAAAARKEARAKLQRARDREIAAILSGSAASSHCMQVTARFGPFMPFHASEKATGMVV